MSSTQHSSSSTRLRTAKVADADRALELLRRLHLPEAGVSEWLSNFLVAETDGGQLVGLAGLEQYGNCGLLRSVAIDPAWQGHGVGHALVTSLLDQATRTGIKDLYLLTTTAATYFPRHGFAVVTREAVRPEVQASVEFQSACPASATVMHRSIF